MPRTLKRLLVAPESTRVDSPPPAPPKLKSVPPPPPVLKPVIEELIHPPPDPKDCQHAFRPFLLPGEGVGRVYQCERCRAIGFRRSRFGGVGKIELYRCSQERCKAVAVTRMTGRGPRGAYIWACSGHLVQIESKQRP